MARKRAANTETVEQPTTEEIVPQEREPGDDEQPPFDAGPNPRSWAHNNAAGVQLWERRDPYEAALIFADKPPQEAIDHMKENGFKWNGQEKAWIHPIDFRTRMQDRLTASRTYQTVVSILLKAKGIEQEVDGIPF